MKKQEKHTLGYALGLVAIAGIAFGSACASEEERIEETPRNPPPAEARRVETIRVHARTSAPTMRLPGEVQSARDANLSSSTGGYVEKVLVKEGDKVGKGQSLAWVNLSVADAQLAQADAQLRIAMHEAEVAEQAGESISKTRRIMAEAGLKQAQAAYRMAAVGSSQARLKAPFTGHVARVNIEQGEVAGPGTHMIRLVSAGDIEVSVSISARDLPFVNAGTSAVVKVPGVGDLPAKVARVSPAADLNTRTFLADVTVDGDHGLASGMLATVEITLETDETEVWVPQHALVTRLDGNGVFVVEDDRARWRTVTIGSLVGHEVEITEGVAVSDELVVRGHRTLTDGDLVLTAEAEPVVSQAPAAADVPEAQAQ